MYCSVCGKEILDEAVICPGCGCIVKNTPANKITPSSNDNKSKTSIALVLGIVGIVFAWLFAIVGHITSIIGIVMGIKEYKETDKMAGLAVSLVGEVCSIFSSIIGAVVVSGIF